jgi:hypothetical protein
MHPIPPQFIQQGSLKVELSQLKNQSLVITLLKNFILYITTKLGPNYLKRITSQSKFEFQ